VADKRPTVRERAAIAAGAGYCCEYCKSQERYATHPFSAEHVVSRSHGGPTSSENLALSCQGCNNFKFTRSEAFDPLTRVTVALFHPRSHRWHDHFAWSGDATLIIGITPGGRATVDALQLNRESVVNFRRILAAAGEHPPAEPADEAPSPSKSRRRRPRGR
jgi:HNH endonuclease